MTICTHAHVLVTGASSGIGRATALRLAGRGYHVYAGVRRSSDGQALAEAAAAGAGGRLTPLIIDVTDTGQLAAAVRTVAGHVGQPGLAGLVNNAGIGVFGPLELLPIDQFRRQLEVNVTGQLAVTQAFLPLLRQARGRVVLIGSIGSRFTPPFIGPLAASKGALAVLGTALRQELAPFAVRVIRVDPGSIRSDAVGKLDDDARRVMAQASPAGQALYQGAFGNLVRFFSAIHQKGSPPEEVARTVERALAAARPRTCYLSGRNATRMALAAALLPPRAQDMLRRRLAHQPAAASHAAPKPE